MEADWLDPKIVRAAIESARQFAADNCYRGEYGTPESVEFMGFSKISRNFIAALAEGRTELDLLLTSHQAFPVTCAKLIRDAFASLEAPGMKQDAWVGWCGTGRPHFTRAEAIKQIMDEAMNAQLLDQKYDLDGELDKICVHDYSALPDGVIRCNWCGRLHP